MLLSLGPSTGYAVARAAALARANAYGALEGLVRRGAAHRTPGPPARFRAADPQGLVVLLAAEQGSRLERLSRSISELRAPADPVTRTVSGSRAIANVLQQLVARAARRIDGVIAAELWAPTLPAWRLAAARATLHVQVSGEAAELDGVALPQAPAGQPTMILVDGTHAVVAAEQAGELAGIWSADPLIALLARAALGVSS